MADAPLPVQASQISDKPVLALFLDHKVYTCGTGAGFRTDSRITAS